MESMTDTYLWTVITETKNHREHYYSFVIKVIDGRGLVCSDSHAYRPQDITTCMNHALINESTT
eukprot:3955388-Heterocapsa_arctica.AAC.1